MSAGLYIRETKNGQEESKIIQSLLKSDFPDLLTKINSYWENYSLSELQRSITDSLPDRAEEYHLEGWIIRQIVGSLGIPL